MTVVATAARPYDGRGPAVAPIGIPAALRRVVGTLHEPNAWTAGILLATGVALIARHPIARAIGTEVDSPAAPVPAATAPATPATPTHAPLAAAVLPAVPTHAPRNPFAALIKETTQALAPAVNAVQSYNPTVQHPGVITVHAGSASSSAPVTTTPSTTTPSTITSSSSCDGHDHRVVSGDSLWSLAARAVHSNDVGKVTIAWHKLYDANRDVVGPNPSLLRVGTDICVPANL